MCLERANSPFSFVAPVHVGRDELECPSVFTYGLLHGFTGLVVEDLQVDCETSCLETGYKGVICWDAVMVRLRLERLYQDDICCVMVCQHDILVATHGSDGESTQVVCEQSGDGHDCRDAISLR